MADYRKLIVDTAKSFIGTKEPSGDDQFIKAYNASVGTNFNMQTAWCAMFVTYCARMAGVPTSVIPNFASCTVSINTFFKPKGCWHLRSSGYKPQPGDLIYYDWNGDGLPQHVGIVQEISGNKVITIEGNTSNPNNRADKDGVYNKNYVLTSRYILGYVEPKYGTTTSTPNATESKVSSLVKSTYVKKYQKWLNTNFKAGLAVDGSAGPLTRKASVRAWQTTMNASYKTKLVTDGLYGAACKAAANKCILRLKSKNKLVYILQGLLYAHGYDPKGFDGIMGQNTVNAVKSFQKARKLTVDGEVGPATWDSLFNKW